VRLCVLVEVTIRALPEWTGANRQQFRFFGTTDLLDVYGLDVETTSITELSMFDPDARMRLIQFGTETEAWVLDPHSEWRQDIIEFLQVDGRRFCTFTNYDTLWCRKEFGIELDDKAIDVHVMARLLNPDERKRNDLKTLSKQFIHDDLVNAEIALHAEFKRLAPVNHRVGKKLLSWGYTNIPLDNPLYLEYAGLDAMDVRALLDILSKRFRHSKFRQLSRREQHVKRVCDDLQWRGMRVDKEYTAALLDEVEREYMKADQAIVNTTGLRPKSSYMSDFLEKEMGAEFIDFTPTGRGSIGKDTLPGLIERHKNTEVGEVFRNLAVISANQNLLNNLRITMHSAGVDGLVHPQINTCQAITGRMSFTKPAMQTFKKTDGRIRRCYIARDGMALVRADYDSQEVRLALAFSGEPQYRRILDEGLNHHDVTAELVFGHDWAQIPKSRDKAKVLNFLQQYAGGPKAIVRQLGLSEAEAVQLWKAWRRAYSKLVDWTNVMALRGEVVNPWGRRIPRDRFRHYANGNYMIQSSGRDVLGDAIVSLDRAGWRDSLWMLVHDEIILEVPERWTDEAAAALAEHMHCVVEGVELTATPEVLGPWWGVPSE
jgi:DNA polymerase I-like protein with 3'-5' exonuclease and polymerase domains